MSLYYEAVKFLQRPTGSDESLASVVYRAKDLKTKPVQVYALISEATKWSSVLSNVIDSTDLLKQERKVSLRIVAGRDWAPLMAHSSIQVLRSSCAMICYCRKEVSPLLKTMSSSLPSLATKHG